MKIPKTEDIFTDKDNWVVAYRHASKYIGRLHALNYDPVTEGGIQARFVRSCSSVTLRPVIQLFTPTKQVPVNKQGQPPRDQTDIAGFVIQMEPIPMTVDFCDIYTPMHFEGTDIQRLFHEMSEKTATLYREFVENVLEQLRAREIQHVSLATPNEAAALVRGRG